MVQIHVESRWWGHIPTCRLLVFAPTSRSGSSSPVSMELGPIHRWDLLEEEATDVLLSNVFCLWTRIWWSEGPPLLCWRRALGRGPNARGREGRDSAAGAGLWRQQRKRPVVEWSGRQVSGRPFNHWWADSRVGACLTLCRQHGENLFHVCSTYYLLHMIGLIWSL
jgi:hypothetical protein